MCYRPHQHPTLRVLGLTAGADQRLVRSPVRADHLREPSLLRRWKVIFRRSQHLQWRPRSTIRTTSRAQQAQEEHRVVTSRYHYLRHRTVCHNQTPMIPMTIPNGIMVTTRCFSLGRRNSTTTIPMKAQRLHRTMAVPPTRITFQRWKRTCHHQCSYLLKVYSANNIGREKESTPTTTYYPSASRSDLTTL